MATVYFFQIPNGKIFRWNEIFWRKTGQNEAIQADRVKQANRYFDTVTFIEIFENDLEPGVEPIVLKKQEKKYPKNKIFSIPFGCVPSYGILRHKKEWWYKVPRDGDLKQNAVSAKEDYGTEISSKTMVAMHFNEIPKNVARFARLLY